MLLKLNLVGRLIIPEFQLDKNIKSCHGSHPNEKRDWGAVAGSTNYGKLPPESFCRKNAAYAIVTHTACMHFHTHTHTHKREHTHTHTNAHTHTHTYTHMHTQTHTYTQRRGG